MGMISAISEARDEVKSMSEKKEIVAAVYSGERPLFGEHDLIIKDTIFDIGESPLKESRNIELYSSMFKWKYPLWYAENITVEDSTWFETGRAGVWYTNNVSVKNCAIEAPKNFRRCNGVTLENVSFSNAAETLWNCDNVNVANVTAKGDYFAMNSKNMTVDGLTLYGNYSFDGVENIVVKNSKLLSKDAFWNSKNVTVYDSFISGEYLGWNSENLTLVNCTIESLQGLCYIDNLVLKNCKLLNTTLAFEYSTNINATVKGDITSVFNPSSGRIEADRIGELIIQKDRIDPTKTEIVCSDIAKFSDAAENG